jgi:hypothetical protein
MKLGAAVAALASLAVGGSALASAAQHKSNTANKPAVVQQGEPAGESASESETGAGDGPGGYADTSDNADTQQQGEH